MDDADMNPTFNGGAPVDYDSIRYGQIDVFYHEELDGGGQTFGQQYIPFVHDNIGPVGTIFEWCAGPGFIGFSLLAQGLCQSLELMDINPDAVRAAQHTVEHNGLQDCVRIHEASTLETIPEQLRFDLAVGNPPHASARSTITGYNMPPLIYLDPDWQSHRLFYRTVRERLQPGGSVLIQENSVFSTPGNFIGMIEEGGLHIDGVHDAGRGYYWIWSRPVSEAATSRAPYVAG